MEHLPAFILFVAIAAFTPGPNNIMIMSSGVNFGIKASIPHLLGICFGVPMLMAALGFGLGALFDQYRWLHEVIKIVGFSFLVYLAYRIATSTVDNADTTRARPLSFYEAALFQWVNPKSWVMGTSAIATYTSVVADLAPQVAIVVLVFFLMTWPAAFTWLIFGRWLKQQLRKRTHHLIFNYVMAGLLIVSMGDVAMELANKYLF